MSGALGLQPGRPYHFPPGLGDWRQAAALTAQCQEVPPLDPGDRSGEERPTPAEQQRL